MNIRELSNQLWERAEDVARYLLPAGKKIHGEWCVGDLQGDKGQSLKINVNGKRVWCEFNGGLGGDLLDLWVAVRSVSMHIAIQEAKEFLGIRNEDSYFEKPKKQFKKPEKKGILPSRKCYAYLATRGISEATARLFKVVDAKVFNHETKAEVDAIAFPYLRDNETLQIKRLGLERNGNKKIIMAEADCEPCLFGWQAISNSERNMVVLCEGEIDAMTIHQYGLPALSVPFGGGAGAKQQWIDYEYENLERFEEIFICMDSDEAGQLAAKEIATRLGYHRCSFVHLPRACKDANECLMKGVSRDEFIQCIISAEKLDPTELKRAGDFKQGVIDAFFAPEQYMFTSSIEGLAEKLKFRSHEVTAVNGVNGHGKSQLVGNFSLDAIKSGLRVCIASLELRPAILLKRLVRQGICTPSPEREDVEKIMDKLNDSLWVFNVTGKAKTERLLTVFKYAHKRYGVKVFIIDSLMMCGMAEDDYNGQKAFIEQLCDFKNQNDVHVFLVTHPRKGESEEKPVGKMDVKGTGAITDLLDNLVTVWRNKKKEELNERINRFPNIELNEKDEKLLASPNTLLSVDKQREGEGWCGKVPVEFNAYTNQFLSSDKHTPFNYLYNRPQNEVLSLKKQSNACTSR